MTIANRISSNHSPRRPIHQIRKCFEQGDTSSSNWLPQPIKESWLRCAESNHRMSGAVDYGFLTPTELSESLANNRHLIQTTTPFLHNLYEAISGAGWSLLLTDKNCVALQSFRTKNISKKAISKALSKGAILNENAIGTSAMSCAIASQSLVAVYGGEHYAECHKSFHCVAAPLFNTVGEVIGSIDITNENPIHAYPATYLLEQCAYKIQSALVQTLPDTICIEIHPDIDSIMPSSPITLAFSYGQQLVGASLQASQFLGINLAQHNLYYEELFEESFEHLFENNLLRPRRFYLTMHSGVKLQVSVGKHSPAAKHCITRKNHPINTIDQCNEIYFGDGKIQNNIETGAVAINRLPILLGGESGVGKEIMARALHNSSPNKKGPFIPINCAAIPEALIESELFGYGKGAFTGASKNGNTGKIEAAQGGTLFLDEVGDMPLALQTRLLRVIETREITPIGSTQAKPIEFQLICATHRDLLSLVAQEQFRKDLYYRLNGIEFTLPPLRDREDVFGLAEHLLTTISKSSRILDESLRDVFDSYKWPGNVRELKHALTYADTLAKDPNTIYLSDLPSTITQFIRDTSSSLPDNTSLENHRKELEEMCNQAILNAINTHKGNKTLAAKALGISRATLYRKLQRL